MATFKEAFREARNAGQKTFMWNGKRYTTELKEEAAKRTSPAKTAPSAGPRRNVEAEAKGAETLERMKSRAERGMAEEDSGMMSRLRRAGLTAKGAEEAGGLSSSAMAALGMAGGALGRGAKASKTASMARTEPRVGRPVTSRLDDAEAAFSRPQAAQVSKETGRRFTAAQEREAAEASIRGAAARKAMAETRAGRSKAMEEAKTQRMMRDEKKKPSPRARTRDEEDIEFSRGGMAKKKRK